MKTRARRMFGGPSIAPAFPSNTARSGVLFPIVYSLANNIIPAVVFFSLQGPLHELSDVYLFSGHMVQHLNITLIFPLLMLLGTPGWMWSPLTSIPWVKAVGVRLTHPIVAFLISTAALIPSNF